MASPGLRAVDVVPDPEPTATWAWHMRELEAGEAPAAEAEDLARAGA